MADDGEPETIRLTDAARAEFLQCDREHVARWRDPDLDDHLRGSYAKAVSYAARLTGIIHTVRALLDPTIPALLADEESVLAGWAFAEYFLAHGAKADRVRFISKQERQAEVVRAWIEVRGGSVTLRELVRAKRGGVTTASAGTALFKFMADAGTGRVSAVSTRTGTRQVFTLAGHATPNGQDPA